MGGRSLFREHQAFGGLVSRETAGMSPVTADAERPLRIAFLSPDLRTHSVAYFIEPLLAHLDPEQFSILLYHDHFTEDQTTTRLRERAVVWRNFVGLSDDAVEALVREDAPDVLIDLAGHTGMNRLALLGRRLAPVQISYLGYPNTTGLQTMDRSGGGVRSIPHGNSRALALHGVVLCAAGRSSDAGAATESFGSAHYFWQF